VKRKAKAKSKNASFRRTGKKAKKAKKTHVDVDDAQDTAPPEAQHLKTTCPNNHILGVPLLRRTTYCPSL